jgi:hypothetical protein
MSAEPQKLDRVVSLLKAKQAPQPPAAFFDQMSHRIRESIERPQPSARTWWERVRTDIDIKACLAGILVCATMVAGLLYALRLDAQRPRYRGPLVTLEKPDVISPPSVLVVSPSQALQPAEIRDAASSGSSPLQMQSLTNSPFEVQPVPTALPAP